MVQEQPYAVSPAHWYPAFPPALPSSDQQPGWGHLFSPPAAAAHTSPAQGVAWKMRMFHNLA